MDILLKNMKAYLQNQIKDLTKEFRILCNLAEDIKKLSLPAKSCATMQDTIQLIIEQKEYCEMMLKKIEKVSGKV